MKPKIDLKQAKEIATTFINPRGGGDDQTANAILEEETIERCCGWLFYYQSRAYVRTRDDLDLTLPGHTLPIFVYKLNGKARNFSIIEYWLDLLLRRIEWCVWSTIRFLKKH